LGLETFVLTDKEQIKRDKNIPYKNKKLCSGDVIIKDWISPFDHEMLSINSNTLSEIAAFIEKNYQKINVEKKLQTGIKIKFPILENRKYFSKNDTISCIFNLFFHLHLEILQENVWRHLHPI